MKRGVISGTNLSYVALMHSVARNLRAACIMAQTTCYDHLTVQYGNCYHGVIKWSCSVIVRGGSLTSLIVKRNGLQLNRTAVNFSHFPIIIICILKNIYYYYYYYYFIFFIFWECPKAWGPNLLLDFLFCMH